MEQDPATPESTVDQRRHYRLRLDGPGSRELTLSVEPRSGEPFEAEILDLSLGGVGVRCPVSESAELDFGDRLQLAFQSPRWALPLKVPATLRSRCEIHPVRRYGFEFGGSTPLRERIFGLFERLDRRRSARTAPEPSDRIRVVLRDPTGNFFDAEVRDISGSGVGLLVRSGPDLELDADGSLEISICLPSQGEPIACGARVRRREPAQLGTLYGLEFTSRDSDAFKDQRERILSYVLDRLRDRFGSEDG